MAAVVVLGFLDFLKQTPLPLQAHCCLTCLLAEMHAEMHAR